MAVNGNLPAIQVIDANGPIVGAKLFVYDSGTTNLKSIYSDDGLSVAMSNPISGANASNASGFFPVFYMASGTYKLRAETSAGVLIWEYDDLDTGLSAGAGALPIASGGTGATTAAAARAALDVPSNSELADLADQLSDFTSSLTNTIGFPQGRLTPTSGTPVISSGVSAGTAVYYTPYVGNIMPIYDGVQFNPKTFAELTLTLASQHTANNIYDIFGIDDNDTRRLVTGPAWSTPTAGSGARGSGAGTTELARLNGILVNANAMATARNGSSTYSVAANQGTYLGSILIDGTNGQISCLLAYGQSRKWAVWNAYNRVPIIMKAGDATASWNYSTNIVRQANAAAGNTIAVFQGLAEEQVRCRIHNRISVNASSQAVLQVGIGWNATNAFSGTTGYSAGNGSTTVFGSQVGEYVNAPSLGLNNVNALENVPTTSGTLAWQTFFGTEAHHQLIVEYRG